MLNSLATTVATPAKWVGRDAPSMVAASSGTITDVAVGRGYISSTDGVNSTSTPAASDRAESAGRSRG